MSGQHAVPAGVPMGAGPVGVVVVGASAGGPPAVERFLRGIPADLGCPVVICQHMPAGFTHGWAGHLDDACALRVREAVDGDILRPGEVLVVPVGRQARFARASGGRRLRLVPDFADCLHVPSVDFLMSSAAECYGSLTLGVLLTGLGSDGALGMLAVRRAGGYTIAQDESSCFAYGMPGSAVELGAVAEVLPLERIAERVLALASAESAAPGRATTAL